MDLLHQSSDNELIKASDIVNKLEGLVNKQKTNLTLANQFYIYSSIMQIYENIESI